MSSTLVGAPFAITASTATARCWAGRPEVLVRFHKLEQSLATRSESSFDLIWANLGAGKSHALYYLDARLHDRADMVSILMEMPEQPKRFLDLYRQVIGLLPLQVVAPLLVACPGIQSDVQRAARAIFHGAATEKDLAVEWLSGGRPPLRDLRNATGIGSRLEDDGAAAQVLADVVTSLAARRIRLVILIDEFQRLSTAQTKARASILANLRSIFSKSPSYFTVILAIASRMEDSAMAMLPGELRTLMGMKPAVSLPMMDEDEAFEFLVKRLAFFRPADYAGNAHAPFGAPCLKALVRFIGTKGPGQLIPRTLLQACGCVFDELENGGRTSMTVAEVNEVLNALRWDV